MRGAQHEPAYLALNPKGKVPTLVVDGTVVTESPVILSYLAKRQPEAKLLPTADDAVTGLVGLADLVWAAGTLHPLAHRVFRPDSYTTAAPEGVKSVALEQLGRIAKAVATRIGVDGWWYGPNWSIVDTYIAWCFSIATEFGFRSLHIRQSRLTKLESKSGLHSRKCGCASARQSPGTSYPSRRGIPELFYNGSSTSCLRWIFARWV